MFHTLQRLLTWNTHVRVDNERYGPYYGSMAARDHARKEAMREVDMAMHLLSLRR